MKIVIKVETVDAEAAALVVYSGVEIENLRKKVELAVSGRERPVARAGPNAVPRLSVE